MPATYLPACGPTRFVNPRRPAGRTVEVFGEYAITWTTYAIQCPCGKWTTNYGDVSVQVANDPTEHEWLCPECVAEIDAEPTAG